MKWPWHKHRWAKWEQYDHRYDFIPLSGYDPGVAGKRIPHKECRQRRVCSDCGKMQDERLGP